MSLFLLFFVWAKHVLFLDSSSGLFKLFQNKQTKQTNKTNKQNKKHSKSMRISLQKYLLSSGLEAQQLNT